VIPALGFEILSFDLQMLARGKKFWEWTPTMN
jgi:hypothetical protein